MALATLSIDLEARLAKLDEGMTRAQRLIERSGAQMERAFSNATKAATSLVAVVGGVGFTALARSIINGVDALNDFADATGTSVENASALEDIAVRTGTSVDTAASALVKFNSQLSESAKKESEAARIFQRLGLNAAELRKLDPAEALLRTAQALQGFADDGDKARLIQELFGKSVREVAPFLKDLADAGQLNAKVTSEQAKAAEDLNKAIFSLQKDFSDLGRGILSDVIPVVQRLVREFNAGKEAFGGFGAAVLNIGTSRTFETATQGLQFYQQELRKLRDTEEQVAAGQDGNRFSIFGTDRVAKIREQQVEVQRFIAYYQKLLGITEVQGGRGNIVPTIGGGKPSVGALGDRGKNQPLEDALKRIEGTDEKKIARLRAELEALIGIKQRGGSVPDSAFGTLVDELAKLDPAARAAAESFKVYQEAREKALELARKADESASKAADDLFEQNEALRQEIELVGRSADERARLEQARIGNVIAAKEEALVGLRNADASQAQIASLEREIELLRQRRSLVGIRAAAEKNNENIPDLAGSAQKASSAARELGLTFTSAFEDAIVNGERFSDVLKGIEKDLVRLVLRKAVTEPLADSIAGIFSGGGGGTSGKDPAGTNYSGWVGAIASFFAGGFAKGGYIPPGQFGLVGENGAEFVSGGRTGKTITPMGRSTNVTINMGGGGYQSRMSQQQQAEMIGREVSLAVNRNS